MASAKLSPILDRVRGKIGSLVFRRFGQGTVLQRTPETTGQPSSPAQTAQRERFKLAAAYARMVMADPTLKAVYAPRAKNKGIGLFAVCMTDYLVAPEVLDIDLSRYTGNTGETLGITAIDDFEVTEVNVAMTLANGQVLESGPASLDPARARWVYTTTAAAPAGQSVSIEVTALDRPGNKTRRTELFA
ncbi:MAG: hypothetical protein RJA22_3293 [Verrucomicrobiota bacterium]